MIIIDKKVSLSQLASIAGELYGDSLINIRPRQNNNCRYVEDAELRKRISDIVNSFVDR